METEIFTFKTNLTDDKWTLAVSGEETEWYVSMYNTFSRTFYVFQVEGRYTYWKSLEQAQKALISEFVEYNQDD